MPAVVTPFENQGQHDGDEVEIVRGEVPITKRFGSGTTPPRDALRDPAALDFQTESLPYRLLHCLNGNSKHLLLRIPLESSYG
jgi:hypothetical protein